MIRVHFRNTFERFGEIRSFRRIPSPVPAPISESWWLSPRNYPYHSHPPSTGLNMAFALEYWDTRALPVAKSALDGTTTTMKMMVSSPSHTHPPSPPCSISAGGLGLISKSKDTFIPVGIGMEQIEIEVRLGVVFASQAQADDAYAGYPSSEGDDDDPEGDGDGGRNSVTGVLVPLTSSETPSSAAPVTDSETVSSPSPATAAGGSSGSPRKTAPTRSTPPRRSSTGSASLPGELTDLQQQLKAALSTSLVAGPEAEEQRMTSGEGEQAGGDEDDMFDYSAMARATASLHFSPRADLAVDSAVTDGDDGNGDPEDKRDGRVNAAGRIPLMRRTSSGLGGRGAMMMNQSRTAPSTPRRETSVLPSEGTSGPLFSAAPDDEATPETANSQEPEAPATVDQHQPSSYDHTPASTQVPQQEQQEQWLPPTASPTLPSHPYPIAYSPETLSQHPTLSPHHAHSHAHVYHHPIQLGPHQYAIEPSAGLAYYPAPPAHPHSPVDHLVAPPPPSAIPHVPPYPMFGPTLPSSLSHTQFYPPQQQPQPHPHQHQPFHFPHPHFQQSNGPHPYGFPLAPPLPVNQDGPTLPPPMEHHQPYLNPTVEAFSPRSGATKTFPGAVSPGVHFKPPPPVPSSSSADATGATLPSSSAVPKLPVSGSGRRPVVPSAGVTPSPANTAHPGLLGYNNSRWRSYAPQSAMPRSSRSNPHLPSSPNNATLSNSRSGHHHPRSSTMQVPHPTPMRPLNAAGNSLYRPKSVWPVGGAGVAIGGRKPTPEANIVDVDKIEQGLDTRTTVMLKNIPNKVGFPHCPFERKGKRILIFAR